MIVTGLITAIGSMLASKGVDLAAKAIDGAGEKAVEFLEEKTGIKLDPNKGLSAKEVQKLKEVELDPEIRVKLADMALERLKEENRHTETLNKQDNDNTANARNLQIETLNSDAGWLAKNFVYVLSSVWTIIAALYIGFITFGTIPEANVRFADTILGFMLGTIVASIFNYFLGSSKGSKDKTDALHAKIHKK